MFRRIVPQVRRLFVSGLLCLLLLPFAFGQQKSKIDLEPSETVFAVMTAVNICGYNDGLATSDAIRSDVLAMVRGAMSRNRDAGEAERQMCAFYRDHKAQDANRELSQYVSLALNLGPAPDFKPKIKEADLPPDASYVLGFVPLVSKFYSVAGIGKIWNEVKPRYDALIDKVHEPLANMILTTDVYLKMPISGFAGRQLIIYVEPMVAPGQVNARNYGDDYYLLTSPVNGGLPMNEVRHTYLHFTLDPLPMKRPQAMKRIEPILKDIQNAPLDDSYKRDTALLVTESLIRAIEARQIPGGKAAEPKREKQVSDDMADGFVLTSYFYDALLKFEAEPTAINNAFPDWLYYMDVGKQRKLASETQFGGRARGEVVKAAETKKETRIDVAQQKISDGDLAGAEQLAQQVANENSAESPQAYVLLGQIATLNRDKENAIKYFEQALRTAKDPKLIAWSHIYLGRIYDVDQERDMAVKHYQAALRSGDESQQLKSAAERGLKSPYERQSSSDQEKQ
jgi:tetratricopeptide (TPR) repeat protein